MATVTLIYVAPGKRIGPGSEGSGVGPNALLVAKVVFFWLMSAILALGCYRYFESPVRSMIRHLMSPDRIVQFFSRPQSGVRIPLSPCPHLARSDMRLDERSRLPKRLDPSLTLRASQQE